MRVILDPRHSFYTSGSLFYHIVYLCGDKGCIFVKSIPYHNEPGGKRVTFLGARPGFNFVVFFTVYPWCFCTVYSILSYLGFN